MSDIEEKSKNFLKNWVRYFNVTRTEPDRVDRTVKWFWPVMIRKTKEEWKRVRINRW